MGEPSCHTMADAGKTSEHMKGMGDTSQHRCIKHLESYRCMGELCRHTMDDKTYNMM